MTADELRRIIPMAGERAQQYAQPLTNAMAEFEINTPQRQAAFIAQVAHESGGLRYVEEIASGNAYEGRHDLGNTEPGDGIKFKGRGLIQVTGRENFRKVGEALGYDFILDPEALSDDDYACRSAAWFWSRHGCNELADEGNFLKITKRVNGGVNGLQDRMAFWDKAKAVLA